MAPRSVAIDVIEEKLQQISPSLLRALLKDKTTGKNIIWATDDYLKEYGESFSHDREITEELITGKYWNIIQPRTAKLKEKQSTRTRKRAEVFTPSWICNQQNNLVDERWFGYKNVFNEERDTEWIVFHDKIKFPEGRTWKDYIDARRMEVTCGEAPYLASRYDATTGERIKLDRRIGLLDRKFRILNENACTNEEWLEWAFRALQATYGYEFQGDNLLIARENILYTFIDNYKFWFKKEPDISILKKAVNIIVWNIWQMDGRTYLTPYAVNKSKIKEEQPPLFKFFDYEAGENKPEIRKSDSPPKKSNYCVIMNWRKKEKISFKSLFRGESR